MARRCQTKPIWQSDAVRFRRCEQRPAWSMPREPLIDAEIQQGKGNGSWRERSTLTMPHRGLRHSWRPSALQIRSRLRAGPCLPKVGFAMKRGPNFLARDGRRAALECVPATVPNRLQWPRISSPRPPRYLRWPRYPLPESDLHTPYLRSQGVLPH
jgi:hypothetical protein